MMKILFQRTKLYSPLQESTDGEEVHREDRARTEAQTDSSQEKGRILTLIIVLGMLVCCLAWTLTIWFYCGANAEIEIEKVEIESLKCSSVPDEYR